jgi:hypothetical protein
MITHTKQLILQVKEMLDRNLDAVEIAHRLHIDYDDIKLLIDAVNTLFT